MNAIFRGGAPPHLPFTQDWDGPAEWLVVANYDDDDFGHPNRWSWPLAIALGEYASKRLGGKSEDEDDSEPSN